MTSLKAFKDKLCAKLRFVSWFSQLNINTDLTLETLNRKMTKNYVHLLSFTEARSCLHMIGDIKKHINSAN